MKYKGESKVLQYFRNMKQKLVAPNVFVEIGKVTNQTGLSDI